MVQHKQTRELYALKYINKVKCVKMKAVANVIQERRLLEEVCGPRQRASLILMMNSRSIMLLSSICDMLSRMTKTVFLSWTSCSEGIYDVGVVLASVYQIFMTYHRSSSRTIRLATRRNRQVLCR